MADIWERNRIPGGWSIYRGREGSGRGETVNRRGDICFRSPTDRSSNSSLHDSLRLSPPARLPHTLVIPSYDVDGGGGKPRGKTRRMFARASRNLLLLLVSCPFTSRLPFHSFLSPSRGKLKLISSRRLTSHANVFLEYFPHRWPLEFNFRPNFSAEFLEGNSSNSFSPIFPPSFKRDERPRERGRGERSLVVF